ncbi:MAG: hypothetical protein RLZZ511_4154 [Cyanobacteriota bacterium]|jgi:hypothetical protein
MKAKVYAISMFLLLFLSSCSYQLDKPSSEDDFYQSYSELRGKISNLNVSVEHIPVREIARYARFEIDELTAQKFLKQNRYIRLDGVPQDSISQNPATQCNHEFIRFKGNSKRYLTWWDIKTPPEKSCYIILPDSPLKQYRAIYDRSNRVMYLYTFTAW